MEGTEWSNKEGRKRGRLVGSHSHQKPTFLLDNQRTNESGEAIRQSGWQRFLLPPPLPPSPPPPSHAPARAASKREEGLEAGLVIVRVLVGSNHPKWYTEICIHEHDHPNLYVKPSFSLSLFHSVCGLHISPGNGGGEQGRKAPAFLFLLQVGKKQSVKSYAEGKGEEGRGEQNADENGEREACDVIQL